jgi:hypothetical protein
MSELFKCSKCKCQKLAKFYKIRENTNQRLKTCIKCNYRHKCPQCDAKFGQKGNLGTHIKTVHDKIQDYKCSQCDAKFGQKGDLDTHIKTVHNKIKDFKCSHCNLEFGRKGNLAIHTKTVHNKIKDYKCSQCDYECGRKGNLTRHIKTCTGSFKISSGEFAVMNTLKHYKIPFEREVSELRNSEGNWLRFDFKVLTSSDPIYIEYDGHQHYNPVRFGGVSQEQADLAFDKLKVNDKLKNDYCDDNGLLLLRIKHDQFENTASIIKDFLSLHTDCEL